MAEIKSMVTEKNEIDHGDEPKPIALFGTFGQSGF